MTNNIGFISTLGVTPSTRIVDNVDNIHSGIINALNIATGENRVVSGFNITQSDEGTGDYTTYTMPLEMEQKVSLQLLYLHYLREIYQLQLLN